MKGKKKIASILACAMLLSAAPVEAMAYTVPDTVRVGLESVCKMWHPQASVCGNCRLACRRAMAFKGAA